MIENQSKQYVHGHNQRGNKIFFFLLSYYLLLGTLYKLKELFALIYMNLTFNNCNICKT